MVFFIAIYDVVLLNDIVYFIINILLSNIKEKRISKSILSFQKWTKLKTKINGKRKMTIKFPNMLTLIKSNFRNTPFKKVEPNFVFSLLIIIMKFKLKKLFGFALVILLIWTVYNMFFSKII